MIFVQIDENIKFEYERTQTLQIVVLCYMLWSILFLIRIICIVEDYGNHLEITNLFDYVHFQYLFLIVHQMFE